MTQKTKILILGGGFGGVYTALELEKQFRDQPDVEITLVNRDNFFLFTADAARGRGQRSRHHDHRQPDPQTPEANQFFRRRSRLHRLE
jgi:NADH dehydrogenase FAD-containing subunit